MDFWAYKDKQYNLYASFANAIADILRSAIEKNGSIKCQQIQSRAKDPNSLSKKLEKEGISPDTNIAEEIKDLAGCRLVLYSNGDVSSLKRSGILDDNFEINWKRTKIHFPVAGEGYKTPQFIGDNYVVSLKPERSSLCEYESFAGLQCEVQVQTILNHAWSETAHDTIYKRPELSGLGKRQLTQMDKQMAAIQQDYLLPAGHAIQRVLVNFERLKNGQSLYDADILEQIKQAENNNDRYDLLEQYEKDVLNFIDDHEAIITELRDALVVCSINAMKDTVRPIETEVGAFPGREPKAVLDKVLSILSRLRFVDADSSFETFLKIFIGTNGHAYHASIVKTAGQVVEFAIPVVQQSGYRLQTVFLNSINALEADVVDRAFSLIVEVCTRCLSVEMEWSESSSHQVIMHSGPVVLDEELNSVRHQSISILMELFSRAKTEQQLRLVYSGLLEATRCPRRGNYSDDLLLAVLKDTQRIAGFIIEKLGLIPHELAESIEEDFLFLYHRVSKLSKQKDLDQSIEDVCSQLTRRLIEFRDTLNQNEDFVRFKTLVGYETVFDFEWDSGRRSQFNEKEALREKQAAKYLEQISQENQKDWFDRLDRYASIETNDSATFIELGKFIKNIAENNPEIGKIWLNKIQGTHLENFLPGILSGLYEKRADSVIEFLDNQVPQSKNLSEIMQFLRFADPCLPDSVLQAFKKAKACGDEKTIFLALQTAVQRHKDLGTDVSLKIAIMGIKYLNKRGNYNWSHRLYALDKGYVESISPKKAEKLIKLFEPVPELNYDSQRILVALASLYPDHVLDLFGRRIEFERTVQSKEDYASQQYEAIPYELHGLAGELNKVPDDVVKNAYSWFQSGDALPDFRSARFVKLVLSSCPQELLQQLNLLVAAEDVQGIEFALAVINNFRGAHVIQPLVMDIVERLPENHKLLGVARVSLLPAGMVRGEHGFRDAYISLLKTLESWREDPRPKVQTFASSLITSVKNDIAAEERRVDEENAHRRMDFNEPIKKPKDEE